MGIQRLAIDDFLSLSDDHVLIDVRSPAEFKHAHIPGAHSLPLFSDEERKIVGTTYKQQSREAAIKIGLDFFGPRMKKVVEDVEGILSQRQEAMGKVNKQGVFVYCWRGGMRSAAVAWLLDLYGFKVHTLAGGYKTFRNYVLKSFEQSFDLKILGGYTGSGKTELLNKLEELGENIVDLEAIACHKGSAFGSYNMPPQPTQEMFENILSMKLRGQIAKGQPLWMEDESQRIGNLNIPNALWNSIRSSPVFFLDIPFEQRLQHLVDEYSSCEKQKLIDSTLRISKRLGPLETKNTLIHLENGETKQAFDYLLRYYDKLYKKGLHNRENLLTLLTRIPCKTVSPDNAELLTKFQPA